MSSFLKSSVTAPDASARARRSGTGIDGDHPFGPQQERALDRELPDGAAAPDRHRLAALQIAEIGCHEAGWKDVGQEQDLLVTQPLWHLDWADIRVGDAEILGLAACVAAQHMGIAEQSGGGMTPQLLGHLVIGVGALAARKEAFLAKETFAAGNRERNYDSVANLELLVFRPDLDNLAHGLMAQDVSLFHRRHDAVEQMEIRAADGAGGDLDDGISPVLDLGIRHGVAANVVFAVPSQRSHTGISMPRIVMRQIPEVKSVPWVQGTTTENGG